ncbi:MAG: Ni/Fe hydrogenase subunit alpha [Thermodesulfobacteriota bacterium]
MSGETRIRVRHVTRVEGHGNIEVRARDGRIEKIEWQVPEAPRFFEAMVRGRSWDEIQPVVSRICGICSVAHSLASLKAVEDAMGIEVPEQTDRLRLLVHYAEQLESHSLHLGYLVVPDLLGVKSIVPLVSSRPDNLRTIIKIHRTANAWMELIGGRMTHPVSLLVGGFAALPSEDDLVGLKKSIQEVMPELEALADLLLGAADKLPEFERDTEYIALSHPDAYTFYHGDISSSDAEQLVDIHEFESVANEYVQAQSTAKWARWHRDSYAVGALARFNTNGHLLGTRAARTARRFGLKQGCVNPFMNNTAQLVECFQVAEHGLELIDELLSRSISQEKPEVRERAGMGVGAVEAPRGSLFHRYGFDEDGRCVSANLTIPTNQNHANIQKDFEALVPQIIHRGQDEVRRTLEMLVRAYDPCISCSTHFLDVRFV